MGLKKNFLFSTILTVSNYIFPFIIYPYVARVLGPNNIGICNFVDGIVNYAVMISSMGIAVVGVREIAKAKSDRRQLDKTFTALLALCTIFTVIATIALVTATYTVETLCPYKRLLSIGILKLWSTFLLIDWLYRGLEDFRYITIRTIAVKTAYLASVFIFIHHQDDYVTYYLLTCLMVTVNAVFNCSRAIQHVSIKVDWHKVREMAQPFIVLGIYILLNSMYTTFNVIYLGIEWGDTEVGYYTTATKIFTIILAIYTAYSGVVMPRVSALLTENRIDEFKALITKSISALILIAVPIVAFTMTYSQGIIYLIAGDEYTGAIIPLTIVMPLVFIIGYEQILVVQTLTPMATDRIILFNSVIGATVGVVCNLALVGRYAAIGSSIVWVTAECVVLLLAQYFVTKKTGLKFPLRELAKNLLAYLPYVIISIALIHCSPLSDMLNMIIGACLCGVYFIIVQQYVLKNELYVQYQSLVLKKLKRS